MKKFLFDFLIFCTKRLKIEERQENVNVEVEKLEKLFVSEGWKTWWGWIFTVIAPFCDNFQRFVLCWQVNITRETTTKG